MILLQNAVVTGAPTEDYPEGEPAFDTSVLEGTGFDVAMSIIPLAFLGFYVALPYYIVTTRNLLFAASSIGPHRFESTMATFRYIVLLIAAFLITIFTFGFGTPFAKVMITKYKVETLELVASGDLDDFVAREADDVRAFGEELGEAFDIDVGL